MPTAKDEFGEQKSSNEILFRKLLAITRLILTT